MMRLWRARYLAPDRAGLPLAGSVVAHAVLVGAAVGVAGRAPPPKVSAQPNSIVQFLAPPNRSAGRAAQQEMIRYVALSVPQGIVPGNAGAPEAEEPPPGETGRDSLDAPVLPQLAGMDSVYSMLEVDSAATRYEWSAAPVYPPRMLAERRSGFVRAEWVVTEFGEADTTTLRILESSDPEFTRAVRDALPFMRFRPARIGRRPVRLLVQQPFYFQITTPITADTSRAGRPRS